MGVNLRQLIETETLSLKDLSGQKIGIDAFNWTYQFLSTIRLPDGSLLEDSSGRVTSHLNGLFFRTMNLLKEGIKPCYVWDGKPPEFKEKTLEKREERKEIAEAKLKTAIGKERLKWAQQTSRLTEEMIEDAETMLGLMGVPSIRAPSEGEAQISHMVVSGDLDACASQDWDALLFGTPVLLRNLSLTGKRKLPNGKVVYVFPEKIVLEHALKKLGITRDQLIIIAMLIGTDYCPGVRGYGPKKAYKIVKEKKELDKVIAVTGWDFEVSPDTIFTWFKKPIVSKDYKLSWGKLNRTKLIDFLVSEREFSEKRVLSILDSYEASKGKLSQKGLTSFFK